MSVSQMGAQMNAIGHASTKSRTVHSRPKSGFDAIVVSRTDSPKKRGRS